MEDPASLVDDEGHPSGQQAEGSRTDPVLLAEPIARIAEDREGELLFFGEIAMGGYGVRTDPDHASAAVFEEPEVATELACLPRSAGCGVPEIEVEYDGVPLQDLVQ